MRGTKNPAEQDSPPAAGRFGGIFLFRRSAIIVFYFIGNPKEFPIKQKKNLPKGDSLVGLISQILPTRLALVQQPANLIKK